jgi:hypothetical protein
MRLKPSIRASVSGSSTAGSAVSSYDPMAHSPNRGTTPLKDETAEPAIPSRWKKSRKTGSSFENRNMALVPICGVASPRIDPSISRMS